MLEPRNKRIKRVPNPQNITIKEKGEKIKNKNISLIIYLHKIEEPIN
jgi:hypothetical protein